MVLCFKENICQEGQRCVRGQNLGTECALSAFAVPATRAVPLLTDDLYMCVMKCL